MEADIKELHGKFHELDKETAVSLAVERVSREKDIAYIEKARELQASEYERRLTVLNHAHEAAVEAQAKTVPREMWDAHNKELAKELGELKASRDVSLGRQAIIAIIIPVLISLAFLIINYLIK